MNVSCTNRSNWLDLQNLSKAHQWWIGKFYRWVGCRFWLGEQAQGADYLSKSGLMPHAAKHCRWMEKVQWRTQGIQINMICRLVSTVCQRWLECTTWLICFLDNLRTAVVEQVFAFWGCWKVLWRGKSNLTLFIFPPLYQMTIESASCYHKAEWISVGAGPVHASFFLSDNHQLGPLTCI